MSYNVFVDGSIYNFGSSSFEILKKELSKVKNPKFQWDEGDLFIKEDFDMRHIEAVLKARDRAWEEIQEYKRFTEAINKVKFKPIGYGGKEIVFVEELLKELSLKPD